MKEDDKFTRAVRRDLAIISKDAVNCAVHSLALFTLLMCLNVAYDVAVSTACLVGAVKMFSTDNDTNYGEHTRQHLRRNHARSYPCDDPPCV